MCLRLCSPRDAQPKATLSSICSRTAAEMQICSGSAKRLQPRRDIDAVAEQIVAARHHVAQIEADPEHDLPILGEVAVAARGHALDRHRAAHRLHRAGELGHDAVAGEIEDPALRARRRARAITSW